MIWVCIGMIVNVPLSFLLIMYPFRSYLRFKAGYCIAVCAVFSLLCVAVFYFFAINNLSFNLIQTFKLTLFFPCLPLVVYFLKIEKSKMMYFFLIIATLMAVVIKIGNHIIANYFEAPSYYNLAVVYITVHLITTPLMLIYINRLVIKTSLVVEAYSKRIWGIIWIIPALLLLTNLNASVRFESLVVVQTSFMAADFISLFGTVVASEVLYWALHIASETSVIREQARMVERQLDMQREQFERITKAAEANKNMRHDLRHHLAVLGQLAEDENAAKIKGYVDELTGHAIATAEKTYCKNYAVNAVAAHYLGQAENEGITVEASFKVPEDTGAVPATDINVILGNFLENALEACRRMERGDRFIRVRSRIDGDTLSIVVTNSFNGVLCEENGVYLSCKEQGERRVGLGLSSVKAICEKHRGLVEYETTTDVWKSSALVHMGE